MKKQMIKSCVYGGGESCKKQGGSGSSAHSRDYVHPFPSLEEVGEPVGDPIQPLLGKSIDAIPLRLQLMDFFDEDLSETVLDISISKGTDAIDLVRKSLYDFDLDTKDGIIKLLELLPVIDREILQDVAGELWPGYPVDDVDPKLLRAEIRGYLMDWLYENY